MESVILACILLSAQTYDVPPAALAGIYYVEGGQTGQAVGPNKNGSYDLGPMQINTLWVPILAKHWKVSGKQAYAWIKDDTCTNVGVSAWILKSHLEETKSLSKAIAYYHSRTPSLGYQYKRKVVAKLYEAGLISQPR